MAGGDEKVFERCLPILECMGSNIFRIGDVGSGETVKIVNNMLVGTFVTAVSEALVLGVKAGVDPETLVEVLQKCGSNCNVLSRQIQQHTMKGDFGEGRFSVDYMKKDIELAMDLGKDLMVPTMFGSLANQMFEFARAQGNAANYNPVVITVWEDLVGVKVRNKDVKES